jgi:DNA processing protein
MERDELADWLRLTLTPGVGNETSRKLLAAFGSPESIFRQPVTALGQVVSRAQTTALQQVPPGLAKLLDVTSKWLESPDKHRLVMLGDPNYPAALLNIEDPPLMLYLLTAGRPLGVDFFSQGVLKSVAIVGSRTPTPQGLATAHQFGKALSEAGMAVISGMALGIDGAAHQGAIDGAIERATKADIKSQLATIAVVGTGLDRVYPSSHRALAHAIAQYGVIVSEYPLGTPPLPENFPKRNRIISGLSQGTLVVEAALKSGSLITARMASEQGREVFAIPGSIHSGNSRGCHALIRQGAKLVETVEDILEELEPQYLSIAAVSKSSSIKSTSSSAKAEIVSFSDELDEDDALVQALGFDPVSLDALQARTGLDTPSLQAQLMTLELDGRIARLPGGLFQRIGAA